MSATDPRPAHWPSDRPSPGRQANVLEEVDRSFDGNLTEGGPRPAAAELDVCPYKGLLPYTEDDNRYFFGREHDIETIVANVLASPLTVLYGASGVGKTSVLQAGVVPRLRKESPPAAVVLYRNWQLPEVGKALNRAIQDAIHKVRPSSPAVDLGLPLDQFLLKSIAEARVSVLFLLDQFEEYCFYVPAPSSATGLDAQLARVINSRKIDANFILSLRQDNLSTLERFRLRIPNLMANMLRLDHLDPGAAEQAVVEPLNAYNRLVAEPAGQPSVLPEEGLAARIIHEIRSLATTDRGFGAAGRVFNAGSGGAGKLPSAAAPGPVRAWWGGLARWLTGGEGGRQTAPPPQGADGAPAPVNGPETSLLRPVETPALQLVLTRLWKSEVPAGSHILRKSTFSDLGGAKRIVETFLDEVMKGLSPADRKVAAYIFDGLVTEDGRKVAQTSAALAGRYQLSDEQVKRVLDALSQSDRDHTAVLRKVADPFDPSATIQYEIYHDVLARAVLEWSKEHLSTLNYWRKVRRYAIAGAIALTVFLAIAYLINANRVSQLLAQQAETKQHEILAARLSQQADALLSKQPALSTRAALLAREAIRQCPTAEGVETLINALAWMPRVRGERDTGIPPGPVAALASTADAQHLAVADSKGGVRVYDVKTWPARLLSSGSLSFSPRRMTLDPLAKSVLATSSERPSATTYAYAPQPPFYRPTGEIPLPLLRLELDAAARGPAASSAPGFTADPESPGSKSVWVLESYDVENKLTVARIEYPSDEVKEVVPSPDARYWLTIDKKHRIHLYEITGSAPIHEAEVEKWATNGRPVVAFSPGGRLLAVYLPPVDSPPTSPSYSYPPSPPLPPSSINLRLIPTPANSPTESAESDEAPPAPPASAPSSKPTTQAPPPTTPATSEASPGKPTSPVPHAGANDKNPAAPALAPSANAGAVVPQKVKSGVIPDTTAAPPANAGGVVPRGVQVRPGQVPAADGPAPVDSAPKAHQDAPEPPPAPKMPTEPTPPQGSLILLDLRSGWVVATKQVPHGGPIRSLAVEVAATDSEEMARTVVACDTYGSYFRWDLDQPGPGDRAQPVTTMVSGFQSQELAFSQSGRLRGLFWSTTEASSWVSSRNLYRSLAPLFPSGSVITGGQPLFQPQYVPPPQPPFPQYVQAPYSSSFLSDSSSQQLALLDPRLLGSGNGGLTNEQSLLVPYITNCALAVVNTHTGQVESVFTPESPIQAAAFLGESQIVVATADDKIWVCEFAAARYFSERELMTTSSYGSINATLSPQGRVVATTRVPLDELARTPGPPLPAGVAAPPPPKLGPLETHYQLMAAAEGNLQSRHVFGNVMPGGSNFSADGSVWTALLRPVFLSRPSLVAVTTRDDEGVQGNAPIYAATEPLATDLDQPEWSKASRVVTFSTANGSIRSDFRIPGNVVSVIPGREGGLMALLSSSSGEHVFGVSDLKEIDQVKSLGVPGTARLSDDGRILATVDRDDRVVLHDVVARKTRGVIHHPGYVSDVSLSATGDALLTAGWDHNIRLWNVASPDPLQVWKDATLSQLGVRPLDSKLRSVCFDGDGRWVVEQSVETMAGPKGPQPTPSFSVYDARTGKQQSSRPLFASNWSLQPDGLTAVSWYDPAGSTTKLDSPDLQPVVSDLRNRSTDRRIAIPRGDYSRIIASQDGKTLVYVRDGARSRAAPGLKSALLKHDPSSQREEWEIVALDVATGQEKKSWRVGFFLNWISLSPEGSLLAYAGGDQKIHVVDFAGEGAGKEIDSPVPAFQVRQALLFSRTRLLSLVTLSGSYHLLDIDKNQRVRLPVPDGIAAATIPAKGGPYALQSRQLNALSIVEPASADTVRTRIEFGRTVLGIRFNRDDSLVAAAAPGRLISVWNVKDGNHFRDYPCPAESAGWSGVMCWSPHDDRLALASLDGSVVVLDARTGKVMHTLRADGLVTSLAFHPVAAEPYLLTQRADSTLCVWKLTPNEPAARAVARIKPTDQSVIASSFGSNPRLIVAITSRLASPQGGMKLASIEFPWRSEELEEMTRSRLTRDQLTAAEKDLYGLNSIEAASPSGHSPAPSR